MIKEEVGKRFKECRLSMGLSQRETASRLGVAQPIYQRFEKGICEKFNKQNFNFVYVN